MNRITLCLLLSFLISPLHAATIIYAGPEIYHLTRLREGGTKQDGMIYGVRVGVDRIKACAWYLGGDYLYGAGCLEGKDGRDRPLESDLTDQIVELRLGFTFVQPKVFFTPFAGWGYFHEGNDFENLPFKFTDTFNYVVVGFLSGTNFSPLLSMGINFKVRFMQDGESKVTGDPQFEDVTLMIENEIHCRLELPITYTPCQSFCGLFFQGVPFYEYRHFGGREGYPFNFKDTEFHIFGARFSIDYGF